MNTAVATVMPPSVVRYDKSMILDRSLKTAFFPQEKVNGVWRYCKGFGPGSRKGFRTIEACERFLSTCTSDDVYLHRIKEAAI